MYWALLGVEGDVLALNGAQHAKADQRNGQHEENGVGDFVVDLLAAHVRFVN